MTLDLSKIKELAEKATRGPWYLGNETLVIGPVSGNLLAKIPGTDGRIGGTEGGTHKVIDTATGHRTPTERKANAAFIAACSPDVILELIERLENLERQVNAPRSHGRSAG